MALHRFHDGSTLCLKSIKELITFQIWKGNRILDREHVEKIKLSIGFNVNLLDSGYTIIKYNEESADGNLVEQSYIIDGQHRLQVIKDWYASTLCEPDFQVVVVEKKVDNELNAIEFFNRINSVKPQSWNTDPNLIINNYITAIEKQFNSKKRMVIRPAKTHRPYLSSEKLRECLKKYKLSANQEDIQRFVNNMIELNELECNRIVISVGLGELNHDIKIHEKAIELGFALGVDLNLRWIKDILTKTD